MNGIRCDKCLMLYRDCICHKKNQKVIKLTIENLTEEQFHELYYQLSQKMESYGGTIEVVK